MSTEKEAESCPECGGALVLITASMTLPDSPERGCLRCEDCGLIPAWLTK